MEWNELIAEIIMAPINFAYWLLMMIADWWGIGIALAIGVATIWIMRRVK